MTSEGVPDARWFAGEIAALINQIVVLDLQAVLYSTRLSLDLRDTTPSSAPHGRIVLCSVLGATCLRCTHLRVRMMTVFDGCPQVVVYSHEESNQERIDNDVRVELAALTVGGVKD